MAIKRIFDFQAIPALAPGAVVPRIASMSGFPRGRRLARLWVFARLILTRGVGAVAHQPQAIADVIGQINGTVGRHSWSITSGRDLYTYQEVARGGVLAHNSQMAAGAEVYDLLYPIPTSYILGGVGELATRPPTEEFEGGSLNFVFRNPFPIANDVDTLACNNLVLFAEHYDRGEAEIATSNPEIKKLAQWGGFWGSRTPATGTIFQIVDVVPSMVLYKNRGWTTMQCLARGEELYSNIIPEQMPILDSDRFNRFPLDPQLNYVLGALTPDGGALRNLFDIPLADGTFEDWTKLFDGRNDRDAQPPLVFNADGGFDFATAGAIVVGRRAVTGSPEVRVG